MVETFFDLDDLETAVAAVRAVSSLPIVGLMSFDAAGETIGGVSAEDAAARLRELGLAAFGANHGAGPTAALAGACGDASGGGAPLAALPNVGLASMSGQRVVFPHATPEYFGEFAAQARALGAKIIGGCCGTTPAQIAAIRAAVDENLTPAAPLLVREREQATQAAAGDEPTALQRLLEDGTFVVSVQLDPPLGANPEAADRDRARGPRLGQGAVRRRERQPACAGADERDHGRPSRSSGSRASRRSRI